MVSASAGAGDTRQDSGAGTTRGVAVALFRCLLGTVMSLRLPARAASVAHSSRVPLLLALLLGTVLASCAADRAPPASEPEASAPPPVPAEVEPEPEPELAASGLSASVSAMQSVYDPDEAMKMLRALDPYFRVRGNEGYRRCTELIRLELREAGFREAGSAGDGQDTVDLREFGPSLPAWTPQRARFEVLSPEPMLLHEFADESGLQRTFVCVNSFPTRPEGLIAPLVRYDPSRPAEHYAGTVVFGMLPAESLFRRAVQQGGALGVVSGYLPDYNEPASYPDIIRYAKIDYDAERHGFALNVSPRSSKALQDRLAQGTVYVKVNIAATFADARCGTVVATIAGTQANAGAVVITGHLDEPGACDNASGIAAMTAMAAGYERALLKGVLPRPRRPIIFLFGAEMECSAEWLNTANTRADLALVMDMVGENQAVTGAIALVERAPDPGAIWDRAPLDIHTEWGRKDDLRESDLKGTFINDYVMSAIRSVAAGTEWRARSNPFEGGSDHESFLAHGIPAVLLWHFTDRFYHTNMDRLDTVDPKEMQRSAVAALGVIHHFATAGMTRAEEVLDLVLQAGRRRLRTEAENARTFLAAPAVAADPDQIAGVSRRERQILVAWSRWYREALLSVEAFDPDPAGGPEHMELVTRIDAALAELRDLEQQLLAGL